MGEAKRKGLKAQKAVALDTFGGCIHVEWDPTAAVTPPGQLSFFKDCPLSYQSNNAPDKRVVLSTCLLSILAGHHCDTHITGDGGQAYSTIITTSQHLHLILRRVFAKFLRATAGPPALLASGISGI